MAGQQQPESDDHAATPGVPARRPETWADPGTWSSSTKWIPAYIALAAIAVPLLYLRFVHEPGLIADNFEDCVSNFDYGFPINAALHQAREHSTHSWEIGYAHEAIMQVFTPDRSVFGPDPFPNGKLPTLGLRLDAASSYAQDRVRPLDVSLFDEEDGAMTDPASLGVAAVMLGQRYWNSQDYRTAAARQKDILLKLAPRHPNGAISHRKENAELWADAVAMFPPFLAYYGVYEGNLDLLHEAVVQIGLYRDVLRDQSGLWKHIVGSLEHADEGLWSTGNAWAAYGIARIRATLSAWPTSNATLQADKENLDEWAKEIVDAVMATDNHESSLLRNYLTDPSYEGETSGTSLLAATAYRMAVISPQTFGDRKYLDWADAKRRAVLSRVNEDGFARPAADPLNSKSRKPADVSPEGQTFLLLMGTAYRDCVCHGLCRDTYIEENQNISRPEPRWTMESLLGVSWREAYERAEKYFEML